MRGLDLTLQEIPGRPGLFDLAIGFDGDFASADDFDTAILVSLHTDQRAAASEVAESWRRRGWLGNEFTPEFELGSKLWLFYQSRLTRTVGANLANAARDCLQWFVEDGLALSVEVTLVELTPTKALVEVTIERSNSVVDQRVFDLWNNTGVPTVGP